MKSSVVAALALVLLASSASAQGPVGQNQPPDQWVMNCNTGRGRDCTVSAMIDGERITDEDAIALLESRDLVAVGRAAEELRGRRTDPDAITFGPRSRRSAGCATARRWPATSGSRTARRGC